MPRKTEQKLPRLRPVQLTFGNLHRLGVREWGFLPTGTYIGRTWRSEKHGTVSCILPVAAKPTTRLIETRRVLIADRPEQQWLPASWRKAIAAYKQQWPDSAPLMRQVPGKKLPKLKKKPATTGNFSF
jgi:hypothetical protein